MTNRNQAAADLDLLRRLARLRDRLTAQGRAKEAMVLSRTMAQISESVGDPAEGHGAAA